MFEVGLGNFSGFMVNQKGIQASLEKIKALTDMQPPKTIKDVQRLTRRVASLNRFISRAIDKYETFLKVLLGKSNFSWTRIMRKHLNS